MLLDLEFANLLIIFPKNGLFTIIPYDESKAAFFETRQFIHSLAVCFEIFFLRSKYILKLGKHFFKNVDKFF